MHARESSHAAPTQRMVGALAPPLRAHPADRGGTPLNISRATDAEKKKEVSTGLRQGRGITARNAPNMRGAFATSSRAHENHPSRGHARGSLQRPVGLGYKYPMGRSRT